MIQSCIKFSSLRLRTLIQFTPTDGDHVQLQPKIIVLISVFIAVPLMTVVGLAIATIVAFSIYQTYRPLVGKTHIQPLNNNNMEHIIMERYLLWQCVPQVTMLYLSC